MPKQLNVTFDTNDFQNLEDKKKDDETWEEAILDRFDVEPTDSGDTE